MLIKCHYSFFSLNSTLSNKKIYWWIWPSIRNKVKKDIEKQKLNGKIVIQFTTIPIYKLDQNSLGWSLIFTIWSDFIAPTYLQCTFWLSNYAAFGDHHCKLFVTDYQLKVNQNLFLSEIFAIYRYKHEILVDGDPVIFEICDTCPKVN